jgi:uncharacterized membrane protein YgaE (UPF0421/DUF939 family)
MSSSVPTESRPLVLATQLATRTAAAAALSIAVAQFFRLQSPINALITAVLVTDLSPSETRKRALRRFVGTVVGAAIGAAVNSVLHPNPYTIGMGIVIAMMLCHVLRLRDAERVAGYVCGIVLLNFSEDPVYYAVRRLFETGLAISMAVLVSFVPKLIPPDERRDQNRYPS